jgi:energy-coupling factor transporter ATP-binding protein EcfA2
LHRAHTHESRDRATVHAGVALRMLADARRVLKPGGELWVAFNTHLGYRNYLNRTVGPTRKAARNSKFTVTVHFCVQTSLGRFTLPIPWLRNQRVPQLSTLEIRSPAGSESVERRATEEPVVLLEGPRSVGKSTLLKSLADAHNADVIDLDDPATRDAVLADPGLFVAGTPPVCVDEYQKAPLVLDAIKAQLNKSTGPGRFLLAGSTRHDALPTAAQSLTGRLNRMTIHPLTQAEIEGHTNHLVETLFVSPAAAIHASASKTTRDEYIQRIARGGFAIAIERTTAATQNS